MINTEKIDDGLAGQGAGESAAQDRCDPAAVRAYPGSRPLRVLVVEDDTAIRFVLETYLSRFGECHVAANGREAVEKFRFALERGERYHLICMDILMPEMDGREAVRQVRELEAEHGYSSTHGVKIIMTTGVNDMKEVFRCFNDLCDAYLLKPVDLAQLLSHLQSFHLVP